MKSLKNVRLPLIFLALSLFCLPLTSQAQVYKKASIDEKKISLTFDDGPSDYNTETILQILAEYNIKATFFVIGENAAKDPARIKMIADAGHEIGNHTYTHCYINQVSEEKLRSEVKKTEELLEKITGKKTKVFRPPGGSYSDRSVQTLEEMGYKSVLWSVDTRDWCKPRLSRIVAVITETTSSGDIILFHDLNQHDSPTPEALRQVIPHLLQEGYEFVVVSELLESGAN